MWQAFVKIFWTPHTMMLVLQMGTNDSKVQQSGYYMQAEDYHEQKWADENPINECIIIQLGNLIQMGHNHPSSNSISLRRLTDCIGKQGKGKSRIGKSYGVEAKPRRHQKCYNRWECFCSTVEEYERIIAPHCRFALPYTCERIPSVRGNCHL